MINKTKRWKQTSKNFFLSSQRHVTYFPAARANEWRHHTHSASARRDVNMADNSGKLVTGAPVLRL